MCLSSCTGKAAVENSSFFSFHPVEESARGIFRFKLLSSTDTKRKKKKRCCGKFKNRLSALLKSYENLLSSVRRA
jgi:hypothetical protein